MSALFPALETLVLERRPDGTFVRRSSLPDWCLTLPFEVLRGEAPFTVEDVFPFLGAFMDEAMTVWRGRVPKVASDFWTETDQEGQDIHLEASAVQVGSSSVLIITQNSRLFLQQQIVLQRARELRIAHDALMREFELKDILVHTIVHDLASPLHSILGSLSLMEGRTLDDESRPWLETALRAATRQRQLISEILDVFYAESTALVGSIGTECDVCEIIARVVREMDPVARQRGVTLDMAIDTTSCRVAAEESRLFRVLTNLLDNGLRHSPAEGVVIVAAREREGAVRVTVDNQGPGVPVELLPRLFEKFAAGGERGGTGLGLYFCRITVERWGGGIGYEPGQEGGSRFWVRLPLSEPADSGNVHDRGRNHGESPRSR